MPGTHSVHDAFVYAYSVDCEGQRLVLHTRYQHVTPHRLADIVFGGVLAHRFDHALPGNILFGVEEYGLEQLVRENAELFAESWRWGWPPIEYRGDLDALIAAPRAASMRAYDVGASFGLSGWVIALGCDHVPRDEPATVG